MKMKVTAFRDVGNLDKERLVMRVDAPCNVGEYLVMQADFEGGMVMNKVHDTYWFPDTPVQAGDYVVLYTKVGADKSTPFKEVTSHFFYWGKNGALWSGAERSAVLMHSPEWQSMHPDLMGSK